MRRRGAYIADCGFCTLAWDAHVGQYDFIENDICPFHGTIGMMIEEEEHLSEDQND